MLLLKENYKNWLIGITSLFYLNSGTAQKQISPCFTVEHPKVLYMPESFHLKKNGNYAIISLYCFTDSIGNVLKYKPFALYMKRIESDKLKRDYNYYLKKSNGMSKKEANKYANWVIKSIAGLVKIERVKPPIRCNEKITNMNSHSIEFILE